MNIRPIAHKSDARLNFKRCAIWLERKYDCTIKRVHTNSGGGCVAFKSYSNERRIEQSMSLPYVKNQNGIAERPKRTIIEIFSSMLDYARLLRKFWTEAVVHAAEIWNHFLRPRDSTMASFQFMS